MSQLNHPPGTKLHLMNWGWAQRWLSKYPFPREGNPQGGCSAHKSPVGMLAPEVL